MATDYRNGGDGAWSDPSFWSENAPPSASDDAVFAANGTYTVTVNAAAVVDNLTLHAAGATLDLQSSLAVGGLVSLISGDLELDGGTLAGGTLVENGGTFSVSGNGNNTLSGVQVQGALDLTSGFLVLSNASTVTGAISLTNASLELDGYSDLVNNLTLAGSYLYSVNAQPLVIDAGKTVQGYGSITDNPYNRGDGALQNSGVLDADVSGQTLYVYPAAGFTNDATAEATGGGTLYLYGTVTNDGAMSAATGSALVLDYDQAGDTFTNTAAGTITTTGGTVDIGGDFTNAGTITATNATLNLGDDNNTTPWSNTGTITTQQTNIYLRGDITTADIGAISRTGGSLTNYGVINAAGTTLDTTTGEFAGLELDGGAIDGGALVDGGTDALSVSGNGNNDLSDVTVKGGLTLGGGYLDLSNGTTVKDSTGTSPGAIALTNASLELGGESDIVNSVTLSGSNLYLDTANAAAPTSLSGGLADTGVDAAGAVLPGGSADPNWSVAGANITAGQAAVLTHLYSGWDPDNASSAWIGATDSINPGLAPYTFTETFTVSGDPTDFALFGTWFIDNGGALEINGQTVQTANTSFYGQDFVVTDATGIFQDGTNTISLALTSGDDNTDGVRLQFLAPVTIDAGTTIQGSGQIADNAYNRGSVLLVNKGTIDANAAGTLTVQPSGFLNEGLVEATAGSTLNIDNGNGSNANATWINAKDGTITVTGATLNLSDQFTNAGLITATNSTVNVGSYYDYSDYGRWTNSGQINVTGGTLVLGATALSANTLDSWANTGTITTNGTTIDLRGSVTLADLGTISRTGGSIVLQGTLNAQGATIDVTQGLFKDLTIDGGTLENATLVEDTADPLNATANSSNTLSNVTVQGGFTLASGYLSLAGTTTVSGAITLDSGAYLNLLAETDLTSSVTLAGGELDISQAPATFTIDAGVTVQGNGLFGRVGQFYPYYYGTAATIDNKGTIDATTGALDILPAGFTNDGLLEASAGATLGVEDQGGYNGGGNWTNAQDGTISATGATLQLGQVFTNAGTITATNSTVDLGSAQDSSDSSHWTNTGTITTTGGALVLGSPSSYNDTLDAWTNTGTITTTGTTVDLEGGVTAADLGTFSRTGGSITLQGTLNDQNGTVDVTKGLFKDLTIDGGTLENATLVTGAADPLNASGNNNNTLNAVTVQGVLSLGAGILSLTGGTTASGGFATTSTSAQFNLVGVSDLTSSVTLAGGNFDVSQATAGSLTLDAGVTVQGQGTFGAVGGFYPYYYGTAQALVNNGTIDADVDGSTLSVLPASLTNNATVEATNGGVLDIGNAYANGGFSWTNAAAGTVSASHATVQLSGAFTNAGVITATDSTVDLGGYYDYSDADYWTNTGTITTTGGSLTLGEQNNSGNAKSDFSNTGTITTVGTAVVLLGTETTADVGEMDRTGGSLSLQGTITNTGATLDTTTPPAAGMTVVDTFANAVLNGGTIVGGTLVDGAGGTLGVTSNSANTLSGVTVQGDLTLSSGFVNLTNGTTVSGAIALTSANAGVQLVGENDLTGAVDLGGGTLYDSEAPAGALTVDAGVTIQGFGAVYGDAPYYPYYYQSTDAVDNQGSILANARGQTLTFQPGAGFDNEGTLGAANGGKLYVAPAVNTTGTTGAVSISDQGVVEFANSVAGQTVTFKDGTGTLRLDDLPGFTSTVAGFQAGDVIDVTEQTVASASYDGANLVLEDGSGNTLATIALSGDYSKDSFNVAQDSGGNGSDITVYPTATPASGATDQWDGTTNAWTSAGDWSTGKVPGATNDVLIGASGQYTLTVGAAESVKTLELDAPGATLAVTSTLYLHGLATLSAGVLDLSGTLSGGSLEATPGTLAFASPATTNVPGSGGTLDDVAVIGGLDVLNGVAILTDGSAVYADAGKTKLGEIAVTSTTGGSSGAELALESSSAITLNQTVDLTDATLTAAQTGAATTQLSLGTGGVVEGSGAISDSTPKSSVGVNLVNGGLISADQPGSPLAVTVSGLTNNGTLQAIDGATLVIEQGEATQWTNGASGVVRAASGGTAELYGDFTNAGSITAAGATLALGDPNNLVEWSNTGTITATDSTVELAGDLTLKDLGSIKLTGGELELVAGSIDAKGATLDGTGASASLDGLVLNGGTLSDATLDQSGLGLTFTSNTANTLSNDAVQGDLVVGDSTYVSLSDGTTVSGSIYVEGGTVALTDTTTPPLPAGKQNAAAVSTPIVLETGTLLLGAAGFTQVNLTADELVKGAGTITDAGQSGGAKVTLDNLGTIDADTAGSINLQVSSLTNDGLIEATNSGSLIIGQSYPAGYYTSFTNASDGVISVGPSSGLTVYGGFTNAGAIDGTNASIDLGLADYTNTKATWQNTGSITVTGGTLQLGDSGAAVSWSNTGTITATNATVDLDGATTTAGVGTITRTGGSLHLQTTLDNTGSTIDATKGTFQNLQLDYNGVLSGGTLIDGVGGTLGGYGGALQGVAAQGGVTLNNGYLTFDGGTTVQGGVSLTSSTLVWNDITDLTTSVTLANSNLEDNNQNLTIDSGATVAGSGTLQSQGGPVGGGGTPAVVRAAAVAAPDIAPVASPDLDNKGVIDADIANQTLNVTATTFQNDGTLEATNGGELEVEGYYGGAQTWTNAADGVITATNATLLLAGLFTNDGMITATASAVSIGSYNDSSDDAVWSNSGQIQVSGGSLTLGSPYFSSDTVSSWSNTGTITATNTALTLDGQLTLADLGTIDRTGGTITLGGVLDAQGGTIDETKGLFQGLQIAGGELENATVILGTGGSLSVSGGTLNDLKIEGDLIVTGGTVTLSGGTTVTGEIRLNNGTVALDGYTDLASSVVLSGGTLTTASGSTGTLTFDSGVTVQGYGTVTTDPETIDNTGAIDANVAGQTLTVDPAIFINDGTVSATNGGILQIDDPNIGYYVHYYGSAGQSWTNDAGGVISATGSTLLLSGAFTNLGQINATNSTVTLGGYYDYGDDGYWTNTGTVTVTGGSLTLGSANYASDAKDNWSNVGGTISATNTAVTLKGSLSAADFGTFTRSGGSIVLNGGLTETGATLDVSQGAFDDLQLNGGQIIGGTLVESATDHLYFDFESGNVLSGVTVEGGFTTTDGLVLLDNGTKVLDAAGVNPAPILVNGASLSFANYSDLVNPVTLANGAFYFGPNGTGGVSTLTIDPGVVVQGSGTVVDNSYNVGVGTLVNTGVVEASGGTLHIDPTTFTNSGLLETLSGATLDVNNYDNYNGSGSFSNLVSGVLTGGQYQVAPNSQIVFTRNNPVSTDAATIILSGVGAHVEDYVDNTGQFTDLDTNLTAIASGGKLEALGGRGFGVAGVSLSDAGTLQLGGGTFADAALTVAPGGVFTGFGVVTSTTLEDDGTITALGGLLDLQAPVTTATGDTGALDIGVGATLELDGADADPVSFAGVGTLQLGDPTAFTGPITGLVTGDTIDLANVAATAVGLSGTTLTVTTATTTLTYDHITGPAGATISGLQFQVQSDGAGGSLLVLTSNTAKLAAPKLNTANPLTLSDVRVGSPDKHTLDITNTATAPADGLSVSVTSPTGALAVSGGIVSLAPKGEDSTDMVASLDSTSAGAKTGTAQLLFTSDGAVSGTPTSLPSEVLTVSGKVFNPAAPSYTAPSNVIVHVGDGGGVEVEDITAANTATAGAYSEGLDASVTGSTGLSGASGTTPDIAAGGSNGTALTASFSTAAAGVLNGTVKVDSISDGTGIDNLASLDLGATNVAVQISVLNYAKAAFTDVSGTGTLTASGGNYTIDLGTVLQDSGPITVQLGAQNIAAGPSDTLSGALSVAAGADFTNAVNASIGAALGSTQSASIGSVTLSTADDGVFSETITLTPVSSNASGYSKALASGPQTLTITGSVEAPAEAELDTPGPIEVADQHVGATPALTALKVTNAASQPAESLDATLGAAPAGLVDSGSISQLDPGKGDSTSLQVGVDTAAAGSKSGQVSIAFSSDDGMGGQTDLSTSQVEVSGKVFREAVGAVTQTAPVVVHVGDPGAVTLDVANTAVSTDTFSEDLDATVTGSGGAVTTASGSASLVAAGATDTGALTASFDTSAAGVFTGTVDVGLTSDGSTIDTLGKTALTAASAPVSITVDNYAKAVIEQLGGDGTLSGGGGNYTLDLGTVEQGGGDLSANLGVLNAALTQADLLSGTFSGPSGDTSEFSDGGLGAFSGLGAGQADTSPDFTLSSADVGTWTETYLLNPVGSNASGYSGALPQETLTVTGTVLPMPPPPPQPGPTGEGWGDVHYVTFDGLHYDFQAEGEFVLAKSTIPGDSFQVQVRAEPYYAGATVTTTAAVAVDLGGGHRATFAINRANVVYVDGQAGLAAGLSPSNSLTIGDATITELSPTQFTVTWNTGEEVTIADNGSYLNTSVQLPSGTKPGSVEGLLGSDSGAANDFQLADGTVIPQPITSAQLYGEFADAWRLTQASSLMDYGPGQTTADYTDTSFPADQVSLANLPSTLVAQAEAMVKAAGITDPSIAAAAALDFLVTGNPNAITGSQNVQQTVGTTSTQATVTATVVASPGAGVTANASSLVESAGDTTVTFGVYLTGTSTTDTTLQYTVVAPNSGELSASAFGGTLPSGSVTIAAGQTSGQFSIDVPAGALGQTPTETLQVQIVAPVGTPVYAPTAQTQIINDQPVAGNPVQPLLGLRSGPGTLVRNGSAYTLNLGDVVQGETIGALQFAILNAASAPADNLAGALAAGSGAFTVVGAGNLGAIAPGASFDGLYATPDTSTLGAQSEQITYTPTDSNQTGYDATLAPITLTLQDTVIAPASAAIDPASPQPPVVALGDIRAGAAPTGTSAATLTVENTAATGSASLDADIVGTAGGATAAGDIVQLAAGASDSTSLAVGLNTTSGGAKSGTVTVGLTSDAGNGQTEALPNQTVTVTGTVYEEGQAFLSPTTVVLHPGDAATQTLTVANTDAANGYSEGVEVTAVSETGQLGDFTGATGDVAAGSVDSKSLTVTLPTTGGQLTPGLYTGQLTVDVTTDGTGVDSFGKTDLGQQTGTVSFAVDNPAGFALSENSGPGTLTQDPNNADHYILNLGNFTQSSGFVTAGLRIGNPVPEQEPADSLVGNLEVSSNSSGAFSNGGFQGFNLSGNQSDTNPQVAFAPSAVGAFSETLQINASGEADGQSFGQPTRTVTVEANVLPVEITSTPVTVDVGGSGEVPLTVTNLSNSDTLTATIETYTPSVTSVSGATGPIAPSDSDGGSLEADFDTSTAGVVTGTVGVDIYDDTTKTDLGLATAPVAITVNNPATPQLVLVNGSAGTLSAGSQAGTFDYNLGSATQYGHNLIGSIGIENIAANPADLLSATFTITGAAGEFLNDGGAVTGVASGQTAFLNLADLTTQDVSLTDGATTTPYQETVVVHPKETMANGTIVVLPDETVLISGTIDPPPPPPAPPTPIAIAWGDVHLTTFDGLVYNFQAAGEFVLSQSTVAGDSFAVQIRLQPYGGSSSVTVMTQIAAQVGTHRVTFGTGRTDSFVYVDGAAVTASTMDLGAGELTELAPDQYKITWNTGEVISVTDGGAYLNLNVALSPTDGAGSVKGLLGSDSGPATDFALADGTPVNATNNTTITTTQLYGEFADAWRVTDADTLLDYGAGQTTATFTNKLFPYAPVNLSSLPAAVVAAAEAQVQQSGITDPALQQDALLDLLATGDPKIITFSQNVQQAGVTPTAAAVMGGTPAAPSVGVSANAQSLTQTAGGATAVTFTAYLTATSTSDTIVDYAVVAPDTSYLDASAFGGTLPTGQVTITAGQTSATFTVDVGATALGTAPTKTLGVQVSVPNTESDAIFAPDAQTTLVNSQPEQGNVATPQFIVLTGGVTPTQNGTASTLALGSFVQGETEAVQVGVTNASATPSDQLTGTVTDSGTGGSKVTGDGGLPDIASGQNYQGIQVAIGTGSTGAFTETLTLNPVDTNETGYDGDLPQQTLAITSTVLAPAAATVNATSPVNLGAIRIGGGVVTGGSATTALSVTNSAASGAAALDATLSGSGDATVGGSLSNLAAGSTDATDLTVGVSTASDGAKSGVVTLTPTSDAGGGHTLAGATQTVDVQGTVYDQATGSIAAPQNLIVHLGDAADTAALVVTNTSTTDGYAEGLRATVTGSTGAATSAAGATGLISAGASDSTSLGFGFSTATAGVFTGAVTTDLVSDGQAVDGLTPVDLGDTSTPVAVTVDNYAEAALQQTTKAATLTQTGTDAYTLDFGTVAQNGAAPTAGLSLTNAATGLADLLGATFSASGDAAFTNTGTADASGLAAGQSDTAPTISLSTAQTGQFSETLTIDPTGSNASGYSGALAPITVTVKGVVAAATATTFTLTPGSDTIAGGSTVNTIDAPVGTLTSGDSIDGGTSGQNSLVLQGGGLFDLRAPSGLIGVQTLDATEGQAAYSSGATTIPSTAQIVYLRDGLDVTVDVASDPSVNAADPHAPGITLYGADDSDTINLGTGDDAVHLGSAKETVVGGGGDNRFYATAATLGATIEGGAGSNTLYLSGGGAATLGANVTGISKVYLLPPAAGQTQPAWDFNAGATPGLAIYDDGASGDTVALGDASQSVTFGPGDHTVTATTATSAAALFSHGSGHNVLELTGGGTFALNPLDSDLTVQLDQASTLDLNQNGVGVLGSAGDDTLVAAYGDLTSSSAIDGGAGSNTLALSGGGIFDLRAPASLTDISTITATEGQGEYRSADGTVNIANQEPIIYLRAGLDATLTLASAASTDAANPHPSGAVIYGADNADVINLGSGTDEVHLGSAAETVNGGSGEDLIYADAATLGATIKGGGGTTLVYVTGGGTTAMGANATGVSEVLLLGPDSGQTQAAYDFTAGGQAGLIIEDGTTGGDTLRIGSASQTVLLSGGDHTVVTDAADATAAVLANGSGDVLEVTDGGTVSVNAADANLTVQLDKASTLTLNTNGIGVQGSAGDDTIVAGYGALTAASAIDGGAGNNTLALSGGGIFDLRAPASLTDIATITATEGQGEYRSADGAVNIAGEEPIIYLRDGLDATVDLTPAASTNAANPHPSGAIIYGADNADVIDLGSGTDTVYLGGASETVNGGAGKDLIYATGSTLGATITGGTGTTTLDLTGGGTATMGSNITGVSQVSLLGSTSGAAQAAYAFTANTTAKLDIFDTDGLSGDSITVGAASQTVLLGAGGHHIYATSANAGAAILSSGTGPNALEITTGGASILNGSDANLTVVLDAAGNLTLSTGTGIIAIGSTGADTITAQSTGQTLTGNGGADTLVGWIGGADSFSDTLANLNGVGIKGFAAKGDVIDVTDATVSAKFTEDASNAFGTLTLTSSTAVSKITLFGQFMASGFSTAPEGTTGTAISYTPPTAQPQVITAPGH